MRFVSFRPSLVLALLALTLALLPAHSARAETSAVCNGMTCVSVIHNGSYVAKWEAKAHSGPGWSCHTFDFYVNGVWVDGAYGCGYTDYVTVTGPVGSVASGAQLCVDATNASGYPCVTL